MVGLEKNIFKATGLFLFMLTVNSPVNCQEPVLKDTIVYLNDSVFIVFIQLPEGEFFMGSPSNEWGRGKDEGPVHKVNIPESFYIGKFEITQRQWQSVMGVNPAIFQFSPDHPVESVSWNDCKEFIECLNKLGKGTFRFPSEAEWEYACRAGTTTPYFWGENMEKNGWSEYAWANSRSGAMTHPVGEKKPNSWGLYDIAGNVWEWCSDDYAPYPDSAIVSGTENSYSHILELDSKAEKVFRGGSWFDFRESHRCANRHRHGVDKGYTAIGLRLVWVEGNRD